MQPLKLTRVLVVPPHDSAYAHELCQGIARYRARGRPWLIQTMRMEGENLIDRARDGEYKGAILTNCSQEMALQLHALGLKVVLVERPTAKAIDPRLGLVEIDEEQVGRMGAEHLMAQGFNRLAYFGLHGVDWSMSQLRGFRQAVVNAGRQCLEWITPPGTDWNNVVYGDVVERWLTKVERPIAIMAFSDEGARRVLEFCLARQWAVPADIAVLGVEDHFFMRECLPIGLSSIQFNSERMGHQAAAMLDRMLRGSPPPRPILIPPTQVVVRQSTHVTEFADADVSRAVAFIRMHVTHGVSVEDLLDLLQISRSTLERRFAEVIGHSPAVEIRKTRLETARRMLIETNMPLIEVTVACGFSSISYFSHSFHHQYNMSPTRYRETFAGR